MAEVVLDRLTRRYGGRAVVDGIELKVPAGRLLALLGPSGCGKTTTLRMVAGHESPDSGRVLVDGEDVTALPPEARDIGMVFQSYALFPHLTVFGNVAFGLRVRGTGREEERERVAAALRLVGLEGTGTRAVAGLSGGEQQRVALARALVLRPRLLLLDEPLSNLDAALRVATRQEIRRIQRESGVTALYVTHDQEEALAIADRVAVMEGGRIRREGTPEEVYRDPRDPFTAAFLGASNVVETAEGRASIRREEVRLVPGDTHRVVDRQFLGSHWLVVVEREGERLSALVPDNAGPPPEPGASTGVEIDPAAVRPVGEGEG